MPGIYWRVLVRNNFVNVFELFCHYHHLIIAFWHKIQSNSQVSNNFDLIDIIFEYVYQSVVRQKMHIIPVLDEK